MIDVEGETCYYLILSDSMTSFSPAEEFSEEDKETSPHGNETRRQDEVRAHEPGLGRPVQQSVSHCTVCDFIIVRLFSVDDIILEVSGELCEKMTGIAHSHEEGVL